MVRTFTIASSFALTLAKSVNDDKPYTAIICPFLSTLIHERAIPIQDSYEREELMAVALNAGLSQEETTLHIHAQFRNIRSNKIDIFALEGLPDEHYSSSGINDCETDYTHWDECPVGQPGTSTQGVRVCQSIACDRPTNDEVIHNTFWEHFDAEKSGYLTEKNLKAKAEGWASFSNDINRDPGVEGYIEDAYTFLMHVFKDGGSFLTRQEFNRLVMERQYTVGYTFGRGCSDNKTQNVQEDFPFYSAYPFAIRDSYGKWLSLSGDTGVEVTDEKTVWTAQPQDEGGYALRASGPTNYEAGLFLNADGEALSGSDDVVTQWEAHQNKDKVLIKATQCASGPCTGYLSSDFYGNVGVKPTASANERFELVYCSLPLLPEDEDPPTTVV